MDNTVKIRRVSTVLRLACNVYLIASPLLALAIWSNFERLGGNIDALANLRIQMEYVGAINIVLGFLVSSIPLGLMMYGVWHLRQLFGLYKVGTLFTPANAKHLHVFAKMLLITVITSPVIDILQSIVLTMNHPDGERSVSINLGSNDLSMLFLAGVMFAIAWCMREGHRIAEENAEFV